MSRTTAPRLIGVLHLPALPGSPRSREGVPAIARAAAQEARLLAEAGYERVIVENFGDAPFFKEQVPPVTIAAMTACAAAIREACPQLELGINVLRNDGAAALAIAAVVGAACVRINVLSGARVTDQGVVEGRAAELLRLRRNLDCPQVELWADVAVKHSAPLAPRELGEETRDLVLRALADAVLVTGTGTGEAVDPVQLRTVAAAAGAAPVYVASGASIAALPMLASLCHGVIVGSALRADGRAGGPVDQAAAQRFAAAFFAAFGTGEAVDPVQLRTVAAAAGAAPVYVASGASIAALPMLASLCHGVIVGSALRADGRAGGPVDQAAAQRFAAAFFAAFGTR